MAEEGSLNSPIPPQDGWSGWWRGAIKDEHNSDGDDNFSDGSGEDMAEPRKRARLQKTLGRHLAAHVVAVVYNDSSLFNFAYITLKPITISLFN